MSRGSSCHQDAYNVASQASRDLFSSITHDLGDLAGTLPTGLPFSSATPQLGDPIKAALPTNGAKLASATDVAALGDRLTRVEAAVADKLVSSLAESTRVLTDIRSGLTRPTANRLAAKV